ncbi:acetyl-CoA carboxylase biotin carboxyl carrier protein [Brevibacillus fluminis]|uniref:Biotin carboxyl carrier protein of acetyl-CoA carboxylase n=2 Tax=Brevibacillus fluminis TaxID=511487 RepID=A0A3M8DIP6_9BACL|nr:acetyl-CoA carboxylase biotin carboxyl carrier protein [Brevibacillus fluminis]RNB87888.1 acetyl-CoA carboxylase biotin carboxyl carrier protein [Brevibacillus fluminis]
MFKIHEIREMIKLVDQSSLQEFEVTSDEVRIYMKRGGAVSPVIVEETASVAAPAVQPAAGVAAQATSVPAVETKPASVPTAAVQTEQPVAAAPAALDLHKITSPMVGTFYRAPEVGAAPYVQPGDQINRTTVVCIVEAMKLFNEIEAEVDGEIVEVLVENGQLVEYGQPLFLVKAR